MASGTESATETSYWLKFFTEAQIPAGDAAHYAVLFSDNRIQRGMLLDLSKEYLTDMGIARLGDIIAILKHAKAAHDQDAKDKALKGAKYTTATASPSRRSTAASRMVDHFLAKTPDSAPMNKPPPPKPPVSAGSYKKSSVFDRLGSDSPTSGNSPKLASSGDTSVFSRLGGKSGKKRVASSNSPGDSDSDDDSPQSPLGYHGILKSPATGKKSPVVPRKKIRVTVEDPVKVTGFDKVTVTGLDKVKVTGLDRVKVRAQPESFDVGDMQSFKVQVSSTTAAPKSRIKRRTTTIPDTSSVDEMLAAAKRSSIQREEVTTTTTVARTQGVLSMDAPAHAASVKTRLGNKVQKAAASSTTSGFGPTTKKQTGGDVKSRLGAKSAQVSSASKLTISTSSQPKTKAASGVFSRLGKKASVS